MLFVHLICLLNLEIHNFLAEMKTSSLRFSTDSRI